MFFKILRNFLLVSVVFTTFSYANDDEWNIHDFGSYVVASVPGEVVHGDKMRFVLEKRNCNKIGIMFSFLTYKSSDTPELQGRKIPIRINGSNTLNIADVVLVRPAFSNMAFFVMFTAPQYYPLEEFTNGIMNDYRKDKEFSITLAHSDDFNPEKYFDVLNNNWKLDKFPEKITEAHLMCTGKPSKMLSG